MPERPRAQAYLNPLPRLEPQEREWGPFSASRRDPISSHCLSPSDIQDLQGRTQNCPTELSTTKGNHTLSSLVRGSRRLSRECGDSTGRLPGHAPAAPSQPDSAPLQCPAHSHKEIYDSELSGQQDGAPRPALGFAREYPRVYAER